MHRSLGWRTAWGVIVLCSAITSVTSAQIVTTLASFDGTDGAGPYASLIQATDGNFYGTTEGGGAGDFGTVFKISLAGTLTTLYNFCFQSGCADGENPYAGLVQGSDGNFYGTTHAGGANGVGTVFKITPAGTLTTLWSFCSYAQCEDGESPYAGLVQGSDGNFYGTTYEGGCVAYFKHACLAEGEGTLFKITPSGTLTVLYSFCISTGCTDGANPYAAGLVQGSDGNFYGMTYAGGAYDNGTVFKITPSGTLTTLYSFCSQSGCLDGAYPIAGLVQASDGNFYGTTSAGGGSSICAGGCGTIFRITPQGTLTTLHIFCPQSGCTDGEYPQAGLVQGSDGNFYGTTQEGGANKYGTVFKITAQGTLTTLYSVCAQTNCTDGADPLAGLTQAVNGTLYGTTTAGGGTSNDGTVFSLVSASIRRVYPLGDFNGNGKADILWREGETGQNEIWFMNGSTVVSTPLLPTVSNLNWRIVGVGDFNGDGEADILWRNKSTGQNAIWFMNGSTIVSSPLLPTASDLNWHIVGVGDFNGDGKADILWRDAFTGQNAIWFMNGATVSSMANLPTVSDLNWQVVGVGDFNGNGEADILWRDAVTGQNTIWFMNGSSVVSTPSLPTVSDPNWQVVGVGDFNGNGKADILWRHAVSGQNSIWFMNGSSVVSTPSLPTVSDENWQVVGVGDFNGNGDDDILWRHALSGENTIWFMNGATVVSSPFLSTVTDLNWLVF